MNIEAALPLIIILMSLVMSDDVTKDGDFHILAIFKRFSSIRGC